MRMRSTVILAAIIPLLVAGCHPDWWLGGDDGSQPGTPVPFEMLARGEYSGVTTQGERIIDTDAEWQGLWQEVHSRMIPEPERPDIDFSKYTVIAVFQGEQGTGGHFITIKSMVEKGDDLVVGVRNTVPSAGCIVTEALTQPYHIVMVEKITGEVTFSYSTETSCNGN